MIVIVVDAAPAHLVLTMTKRRVCVPSEEAAALETARRLWQLRISTPLDRAPQRLA